jgi:hypothetical protein
MFDSESYSNIKIEFDNELLDRFLTLEGCEVTALISEWPRVYMPLISFPKKTVKNSINEWLEELLCSSKNIEILAENSLGVIGKGDDDLRIREMTKEERNSMKKYTTFFERIYIVKRTLQVSFYFLPFFGVFILILLLLIFFPF